jgi:hypothetical protein
MRRLACLVTVPLLFDIAFACLLSLGGHTQKTAPPGAAVAAGVRPARLIASELAKDTGTGRIEGRHAQGGITLLVR